MTFKTKSGDEMAFGPEGKFYDHFKGKSQVTNEKLQMNQIFFKTKI
jgi:hypothetical protein